MPNGRIFHLGAGRSLKRVDRDLFAGRGAPKWGCRNPQTEIQKNKGFVGAAISNVLRDLPFSRSKSLKSADDLYIGIL